MSMTRTEKKSGRKRTVRLEPRSLKRQKLQTSLSTPNDFVKILKDYQEKATDSCAESSSNPVWMALNIVLDHTTFENSLLQHGLSKKQDNNVAPLVTRAYKESFMRESMLPEDKQCSLGQYCECNFIDRKQNFVGVAFVMPDLLLTDNSMCILCLRKLTQLLFYRVDNGGYQTSHVMQIYGNICDVPGEYHSSAKLVMPKHSTVHSMPLPVVAHQSSKYRVFLRHGKRHLKQVNV
jgi:hypothetical protein